MRAGLLIIMTALLIGCSDPITVDQVETEIHTLIQEQQDAWNRGDFEGFMAPYWKSDALTFQSGNTRRIGWETLLNMYTTKYAGEKRGTLTFSDIEVKLIAEDLVMVLGRWNVTTVEEENEGLYTLIFRHFKEGWRIIHDHSS